MVLPGIGVRKETCQPSDLSNKGDCTALGAWHLEADTGFVSHLYLPAVILHKLLNSYVHFLSCKVCIVLMPPHGATMRIKSGNTCKVYMYLIHFKSLVKVRGGDRVEDLPLPPVVRGYARRGRNMHQMIGYGQTSGVGGRTLKAGSIRWHRGDYCCCTGR